MADKPTLPEPALEDLLAAGLHFGHQTKRWNPSMKRFIFGEKGGIYIIDLQKTRDGIKEANDFLYDIVLRGKQVLFVGTKKQAQEPIKEVADKLGQPFVITRWLGGMLTNNETIRNSVRRMRDLQTMKEDGGLDAIKSKKEQSMLRRELDRLERNLSGIAEMPRVPSAVIIFDVNRESIAVTEAQKLGIPVIALVDSNSNPDGIDFPIPGNDDGARGIRLITELLGDTIQLASNEYITIKAEEDKKRAEEEAQEEKRRKAAQKEREERREAERKERTEALEKKRADEAKVKKEKAAKETAKAKEPAKEEKAEATEEAPAAEAKAKAEPKAKAKEEPKAKEEAPAAEAKAEAPKAEEAKAEEPAPEA